MRRDIFTENMDQIVRVKRIMAIKILMKIKKTKKMGRRMKKTKNSQKRRSKLLGKKTKNFSTRSMSSTRITCHVWKMNLKH